MKFTKSTHLIVLAIVVFHMLFSMAWYSYFQNDWLTMSRITEEQALGVSSFTYVLSMIAAALALYTLAWLFQKLGVKTWKDGLKFAAIFGSNFFLLELIVQDKFSIQPLKLSLINGLNYYIMLLVAGAFLGTQKGKL